MTGDDMRSQVSDTSSFSYPYIGHTLKLDGIAIRSVAGDPERFRETVESGSGAD